jgi:hypothetical protein
MFFKCGIEAVMLRRTLVGMYMFVVTLLPPVFSHTLLIVISLI